MKIYVAYSEPSYYADDPESNMEGSILGVYSTFEKAGDAIKERSLAAKHVSIQEILEEWGYSIQEFELDEI